MEAAQTKLLLLKGGFAGLLALLTRFLGGADLWLYTLIAFTIADYVSGLVKAVLRRELHSRIAFTGGLRKLLIYLVVGIAASLDALLLPEQALLRQLAVGYYIATEGLSILENVALCGVPFPEKLRSLLLALKKDNSGEDAVQPPEKPD